MESEMIYLGRFMGGAKLLFPSLEAAMVRDLEDIGECGESWVGREGAMVGWYRMGQTSTVRCGSHSE